MPALQQSISIAAGVTNANIVPASAFEFARVRQLLSLGVTIAATGLFVTIQSGSDVILEESPGYIVDQFPIVPDQMFYNDIMEAGDRLRIGVRSTAGGAVVARFLALMTQV